MHTHLLVSQLATMLTEREGVHGVCFRRTQSTGIYYVLVSVKAGLTATLSFDGSRTNSYLFAAHF